MASFVPTAVLELAPVIVTFGIVTAKLISATKLVLSVIFRIAATLIVDRSIAILLSLVRLLARTKLLLEQPADIPSWAAERLIPMDNARVQRTFLGCSVSHLFRNGPVGAAFRALSRMACATECPAAFRAWAKRRRHHEMQRVVTHEAGPLHRGAGFAKGRLQPPHRRVPVQAQRAVRLAAPDLDRETMHLHRQFERLDPLDGHPRGVLPREVVELGAVLPPDCLGALLLPMPSRIALGQRERPEHGLAAQVVVVEVQPVLVTAKPSPQAFDERVERRVQPGRQGPGDEVEQPRTLPHSGQRGIVRRRRIGRIASIGSLLQGRRQR